MHSVFGTAKATQEADNVLILQHELPPPQPYVPPHMQQQMAQQAAESAAAAGDEGEDGVADGDLGGRRKLSLEIHKNRFDGTLGRIPLEFDEERMCYTERAAAPPPPPPPGAQKLTMPNAMSPAPRAPAARPTAAAAIPAAAPPNEGGAAASADDGTRDTVEIMIQ